MIGNIVHTEEFIEYILQGDDAEISQTCKHAINKYTEQITWFKNVLFMLT